MKVLQSLSRGARVSQLIALIGVVGAFGAVLAQAGTIADTTPANPLSCGDKTFGFTNFSSTASGLGTPADPNLINLLPINCGSDEPGPGIDFAIPPMTVDGIGSIDASFSAEVISTGDPITDAKLTMASSARNAVVTITESIYDIESDLIATLTTSSSGSVADTVDLTQGYQEVIVQTSIDIESTAVEGFAQLNAFNENFSETPSAPEPGTITTLGMGIFGVALGYRRRQRSAK